MQVLSLAKVIAKIKHKNLVDRENYREGVGGSGSGSGRQYL